MYTAKTTLYLVNGKATDQPQGEPGTAQVYLVTGAVISKDEARRVGLLPPLLPPLPPSPETPAETPQDAPAEAVAPEAADAPAKAAKTSKTAPSA